MAKRANSRASCAVWQPGMLLKIGVWAPAFIQGLSPSSFTTRHVGRGGVCQCKTVSNRRAQTKQKGASPVPFWISPISALERSNSDLVDSLLVQIGATDGGPDTEIEVRRSIDGIIRLLCERGRRQTPLSDGRIFDQYEVAYTSSSGDQNRRGAPAGGRFRGRVGRLLFRSRGLYQHLYGPNVVVNLVAFRLLGLIPGAVGLYGKLTPIDDDEIPNSIRVNFGRPRISFGGLVFEFGPPSAVQIQTTYLDDRVRIGVGSRGSLFVFTKGGEARGSVASEWQLLFSDKPKALPFAVLPAVLGAIGVAAYFSSPATTLCILLCVFLAARQRRSQFAGNPASRL